MEKYNQSEQRQWICVFTGWETKNARSSSEYIGDQGNPTMNIIRQSIILQNTIGTLERNFSRHTLYYKGWEYNNKIQQQKQPKKIGTKKKHLRECDDMSSKQVRTEVPVDGQTVSKYSLVSRTVDLAAARNSLFYH